MELWISYVFFTGKKKQIHRLHVFFRTLHIHIFHMTHIFLCFRIWYIYIILYHYIYISNKKNPRTLLNHFFSHPDPLFPQNNKNWDLFDRAFRACWIISKKGSELEHWWSRWREKSEQIHMMRGRILTGQGHETNPNNALVAHKIFTYICMLRSPTNENRWHLMTPVSRTPFLTYILLVAKSASSSQVIMMSSLTSRITSYHLVENLFFW